MSLFSSLLHLREMCTRDTWGTRSVSFDKSGKGKKRNTRIPYGRNMTLPDVNKITERADPLGRKSDSIG